MKKLTKKEVKDLYLEWNHEITKLDDVFSTNLKLLQDLTKKYPNFELYCSPQRLVEQLAGTPDFFKAISLYDEIKEAKGQLNALRSLACKTNNMNV